MYHLPTLLRAAYERLMLAHSATRAWPHRHQPYRQSAESRHFYFTRATAKRARKNAKRLRDVAAGGWAR